MFDKRLPEQLKKSLSPNLFRHCSGVAETAAELAVRLGYDENKAWLAGWLHDCAREWPEEKLLSFAQQHSIETDKYSLSHPILLHAPVGALVAQAWGITDSEILLAIRNHTLGYPGMSLLEQIIYAADKIEPGRNYHGINELRKTVQHDFQTGLRQIAAQSIHYTLSKKQPIHPITAGFWNWLVESCEEV